jgi:adenosylcobinamide-GDP ribazoletransferase
MVAAVIAIVIAVFCVGSWTLALIVAIAVTGLCCAAIAQRKIGGQTGDILGATQQLTELAALATLTALAA